MTARAAWWEDTRDLRSNSLATMEGLSVTGYLYDGGWEQEQRRLAGIEATFDGFTAAALDRVGVQAGWRCLDVGAGGGSVARELAARGASVVASDLDVRHLKEVADPRVEVRRHDVLADDLESESFDLVHARMLLEHIPERDDALKRMLGSVTPGGWLLIEDVAYTEDMFAGTMLLWPESGGEEFRAARLAVLAMMRAAGFDGSYAHRLPGILISLGLEEVGSELRSNLIRGGSAAAAFNELSLTQLSERLIASGKLTEDQVETALRAMRDPACAWMSVPLVSAWGRKPR